MSWERSGIPGGYTGTDWHQHDVTTMWQAVEDQHTDSHWKLVSGWRRTAELTSTHLSRLEQYRANLIAAWPPDRNAAAAAYVSRLDFLIQNVRTTHEVAVANYTTFGATVGALASAQRDLKPLYDEYARTRQAIRDYESMVAHNSATEAVSTIGRPPATQADLEVLNNRARAIMFSLSHTLIEAQAALKHPPTYPSQSPREDFNPDIYHSSTGQPVGRSGPSAAVGNRAYINPSPPAKLAASGPSTGYLQPRRQPRLIPNRETKPTLPAPSAGLSHPPNSEASVHPDGDVQTRTRRRLSAGGVIGATRGTTESDLRQPPARVNPVGGVIGTTHPPLPAGMLASSRSIASPMSGRPRLRRISEDSWDVIEGVPPVLQPSQNPVSTDPGPAIGLSN
ncbi:hypothetical protein K1W54_08285 [Micromonospora sp. CPCC 205371]|nr:hypothetical protein [Micromonospora sp. CPCC 205371]